MRAHLSPCPACDRHVRVDELSCPFCGVEFHPHRRDEPEYVLPPRRLLRYEVWLYRSGRRRSLTAAAVFAAGGALALEASACSGMSAVLYGGDAGCPPDVCIPVAADCGRGVQLPHGLGCGGAAGSGGGAGSGGSAGEGGGMEGGAKDGAAEGGSGEGGDAH